MFEIIAPVFKKIYGNENNSEPLKFFAPGRVNLIGEHTDHEGGYVFPCAITSGIYALALSRPGKSVRLYSLNFDDDYTAFEIDFNNINSKITDGKTWVNYPLGVIKILLERGFKFSTGVDIMYYGNLPGGSGLSSSAAIEVLTVEIFNTLFNLNINNVERALISQQAENNFVGMMCGIMDQFAVSAGKKNHAILLNCSNLDYSYVPLNLKTCKIVITNSNVPHSLAGSEYNLRREQCEAALKILQSVKPELKCLCDLTPNEFDEISNKITDPVILKRATHVIDENYRAIAAAENLKGGDLTAFGVLMQASHISLRDNYQVTVPELDILAETAWTLEGVRGSRMTGGGFGGCTVSIVEENAIENFKRVISETYTRKTGRKADFYILDTSDGAGQIIYRL